MIVLFKIVIPLAIVVLESDFVTGHGRLIEPASRNAMWRFKYKNPRNYNDMGLNCGGFTNQFEKNGGRCGVCGDPWTGEREHEAGGKYANGVIARQYKVGSFINVTVTLTSNHMGYFEFRLCPVNNPRQKVTQACLDRHLLNIAGHGTRYFIMDKRGYVHIQLFVMLPPKLKCAQCVFQWKYVAGQSMGPDGYGGECLGCGNQEHFVNCADIAIGDQVIAPLPQRTTPAPPVVMQTQPSTYQVLHVQMQPQGVAPTIYTYGSYGQAAPPSQVGYNVLPIAQPPAALVPAYSPTTVAPYIPQAPRYPTAPSQNGNQWGGQVQGWKGSQASSNTYAHVQAQGTYNTNSNPKPVITIIPKANPYAKMNAVQNSLPQAPSYPQPNTHAQHSQIQPQPKPPAPPSPPYQQQISHVPQAPSYPQPNSHIPKPAIYPQANSHVPLAHTYPQPNNHIPQVPTYPKHNTHVAQAYQQQNTQIQTAHYKQPNIQAPAISHVQPKPAAVASHAASNRVVPTNNPAASSVNGLQQNFHKMKSELLKLFPNLLEGMDWLGDTPTPTPTDPTQVSYPGYEPGEYPEPGENPATQRPSSSGVASSQSSGYMQGYNDAMRELKRKYGIPATPTQHGSSSAGKRCPGGAKPTCRGINEWQGKPQFDTWCTETCSAGECPSNFCSCTCPGTGSWKSGPTCKGVDPAKGSSMDTWCTLNCKGGNCPPEMCVCL